MLFNQNLIEKSSDNYREIYSIVTMHYHYYFEFVRRQIKQLYQTGVDKITVSKIYIKL